MLRIRAKSAALPRLRASPTIPSFNKQPTHFSSPSTLCSWLGLAAVSVWVAVTLVLVAIAAATGAAHPIQWLPNLEAFSGGRAEVAVQIVGVIPVLATAYTW